MLSIHQKRDDLFVLSVGLAISPLQNTQRAAARSAMRRTENFWLNGLQLIRHAVQAFRVTKEQISVRSQVTSEPVDDFQFRFPFKVNDHVAAKDQVERPKDIVLLLDEIQPLEAHHLAKFLRGF